MADRRDYSIFEMSAPDFYTTVIAVENVIAPGQDNEFDAGSDIARPLKFQNQTFVGSELLPP